MDRHSDYPAGRPSYYSSRFNRTLYKTCAAMEVEPLGIVLLGLIASLEDSKHYTGAVLYTDQQMMPVLGLNHHQLIRVRQKCVDHGWLHFEASHARGVPSKYWTLVPERLTQLGNVFEDEDYTWCQINTRSNTGSNTRSNTGSNTRSNTGSNTTVFPVPSPVPPPPPDEWAEAEEELRRLGMGCGRRALTECRKHGLQPGDVQSLLAWWREHQQEFSRPVGALYIALCNAHPEHRTDCGKPFPRPAEAAQHLLEAQATKAAQAADDLSRAQTGRLRQLEFDWGAHVKGLTIPEIIKKFDLPPDLQTKLQRYRTWHDTSRADEGLRIEVLTVVGQRLAS